jgi:hypothetical protein
VVRDRGDRIIQEQKLNCEQGTKKKRKRRIRRRSNRTREGLLRRSGSSNNERTATVKKKKKNVMNKQTSRIMRNRSTLPMCNCSFVMHWHVSYGQLTCWEQSMAPSHDGGTRKV